MSSPVRLDAAGPELTPRTLPVQLDRIRQGTLNTVLATVASLEGPRTVAEGDLAVVRISRGRHRWAGRSRWSTPSTSGSGSTSRTRTRTTTSATTALLRRGFSEEEVVGIMGENFLRAFAETWGPGI